MPSNEPPEDETPRASKAKLFDLGADTEPVILSDKDANIGDAIDTFNGLERARRAARRPENERLVNSLEETFQEEGQGLKEGLAGIVLADLMEKVKDYLKDTLSGDDSEVLDDVDEETAEALQASRLLSIEGEEVSFTGEAQRRSEEWQDGSLPEPLLNIAEAFLEDQDWGRWAEWGAPHVIYWNRRELVEQIEDEGGDPERMSDEEWHRRFNERLESEMERHVSDLTEIMVLRMSEVLRESIQNATSDGAISLHQLDGLLGLDEGEEDDAPAPRPSPSPFDLATGVATFPTDPATRSNLKGISGEGDWTEDSFGRPVYRYTIQGPPWDGNAQLSVKEAIEAETAWKMLRDGKGEDRPAQFHADAVALYLLFLAYAGDQAPENRPGENGEFRIRGKDAFRILNLPSGWDLQKKVRHVYNLNGYLNSFQLQLKRVTYEGQKKRTDAISPAQLWDTYLRGVQEEDLHGNVTNIEFWIEGREGAWADLFVHDNDNWTPWGGLPIRMLEEMDGRNRFNRLILFRVWILFRVEKGTVKRTGDDLLKWCRVVPDELSRQTVSRRRTTILNALEEIKQKGFHIDDSRLRAAQGAPLEDWQAQPVYFYPPPEIVKACPQVQAPKGELPEPRSEVWTGKRVRALRKHIGETQGEFGKRLPNREGGMGVKQPRVSTIEQGNHSLTERQEGELDEMAEQFGFDE